MEHWVPLADNVLCAVVLIHMMSASNLCKGMNCSLPPNHRMRFTNSSVDRTILVAHESLKACSMLYDETNDETRRAGVHSSIRIKTKIAVIQNRRQPTCVLGWDALIDLHCTCTIKTLLTAAEPRHATCTNVLGHRCTWIPPNNLSHPDNAM